MHAGRGLDHTWHAAEKQRRCVCLRSPKQFCFRGSAELFRNLKVSDRRRIIGPEPFGIFVCRSVAQCRVFWACFGFGLGPNPVRNRIFVAGSLKVSGPFQLTRGRGGGAAAAQIRCFLLNRGPTSTPSGRFHRWPWVGVVGRQLSPRGQLPILGAIDVRAGTA